MAPEHEVSTTGLVGKQKFLQFVYLNAYDRERNALRFLPWKQCYLNFPDEYKTSGEYSQFIHSL